MHMQIVLDLARGQFRKIARKLVKDERGAGLLEYVFLIVAVLLLAAAAFKSLGPKIGDAAKRGEGQL
jgi:Flp pilus assembly pilin Flp